MSVLTVDGLHAWSIMYAGKTTENRGWRPKTMPAQLAIHAGKRFVRPGDPGLDSPAYLAAADAADAATRDWLDVRGAIVGVVEVVDLHDGHLSPACVEHGCFVSGWGRNVDWHWVLANPLPLDRPLYMRGRQGLWSVPRRLVEMLLA